MIYFKMPVFVLFSWFGGQYLLNTVYENQDNKCMHELVVEQRNIKKRCEQHYWRQDKTRQFCLVRVGRRREQATRT